MKVLAFLFAVLSSTGACAQDYAFKVLINKGQNDIKAGSEWIPVKVGTVLKSADELGISQNGYLGLVHATGKPLEVKEPGQHKVVDLAAKIKEGTSVLNKYTDFILSSKDEGGNSLTATGPVRRGTGDIKLFLPVTREPVVFNDEIAISWARLPETKTYIVRFNSMFGDELEKLEVSDTSVNINLNSTRFRKEDNILVEISSKSDPTKVSEQVILKKLSTSDKKRINVLLAEIADYTREETALNQLVLGSFYENYGLLIDAATAYRKAIKLAPSVGQYQTEYLEFLDRQGL